MEEEENRKRINLKIKIFVCEVKEKGVFIVGWGKTHFSLTLFHFSLYIKFNLIPFFSLCSNERWEKPENNNKKSHIHHNVAGVWRTKLLRSNFGNGHMVQDLNFTSFSFIY